MGVETLDAPNRGTILLSDTEAAAPTNGCALEALAQILERLLHREVQVIEVRHRAVGLGLLRLEENDTALELTPKTASRLLLAAYRLPAHVHEGKDGDLMVIGVRQWDDLPTSEGAFFGGHRDRDGSFHWDMAECDTDATGNILRVYCSSGAEE